MVGIPLHSKRTITKNIYFCNYKKNDEEDGDKCEVDSDGDVGTFFDSIEDEKEFDYNRENPVSMEGEGHVEVKY